MRTFLVVVISMLAACNSSTAKQCSTDSDCTSDAFCNAGVCHAVLTVTITSPASAGAVYTNGSIDFQIDVAGGAPDKLELLSDGTPFAELKAPYAYAWDTRGLDEGTYAVTARATIGRNAYASAPLTVVVDRTPPAVTDQAPIPGDLRVPQHSPIYVDFSEPVKLPLGDVDSLVTLTGNNGVSLAKRLSLSKDGTRLDIAPLLDLEVPSQVTLALNPGITDLAGNGLTLPPPWSWRIPSLCSRDADCTTPELCVNGMCQPANPNDCRLVACSVAITAPSSVTYASSSVAFQVSLSGATPDKVELLKNGSPLATLAPPYQFTWDTSAETEATYQIVARATQGPTVYTSGPRTVVVDRTPPSVIAQSPASGDRNIALHAPIWVQFSEPVRLPASSPESVVSLAGPGGTALSARVALSDDLRTLRISYAFDPVVPADISLSLKPGIADLAGNPLVIPDSWSWHMPVWLKLGPNVAKATSIQGYDFAVDALDRPTVAWGETGGIRVVRWTGSAWEEIGSGIRGPGSTNNYRPVIALKPMGDPVLAWVEDTIPDPQWELERVFVKHKAASGWEYLGQNPIGPDNSMMSRPSLAIDAMGGIWLGIQEAIIGKPGYHAVVRKYDDSLYWPQQGGNLNRAERTANGPTLAFDGGGTLWAAWTESAGFGGIDNYTVYDVFASKLVSGTWTWVGGVLNDNANAPAYNPRLAVVPGGFPIVTWVERLGSTNFQAWYRIAYSTGWGSQLAAIASSFYRAPPLGGTSAGDLYAPAIRSPYFVYRKAPGQAAWAPVGNEEFCENPRAAISNGATIRTTASGEVLLLWAEEGSLYVKRLNR